MSKLFKFPLFFRLKLAWKAFWDEDNPSTEKIDLPKKRLDARFNIKSAEYFCFLDIHFVEIISDSLIDSLMELSGVERIRRGKYELRLFYGELFKKEKMIKSCTLNIENYFKNHNKKVHE